MTVRHYADNDFNTEDKPGEPSPESGPGEPNSDNEIRASTYEAPGIVLDKKGNRFTRPVNASNILDNDPLFVPNREQRLAEGYYQYFEKIDFVPLAISRGFSPVSRKAAGFQTISGLPQEYGLDAGDVPHRIHDLVLMEAPIAVYEAIDKERQRTARAAIEPILKTANKVDEEPQTGNKVEDFREASITGTRIKDIQEDR